MRYAPLILAPVMLLAVAACGPGGAVDGTATPASPVAAHPTTAAGSGIPPQPQPANRVPACPYLNTTFVEDANGQHVGAIKVSAGDQAHPACFFYRPDGGLQLTVEVYVGTPAVAKAIVDRAAPVATSDPATEPAGWSGGAQDLPSGSVYAVAKGGDAVVATTNQKQTIKARRVVTQAIQGLGL
jgi:UPF0176 protein